MEFKEWPVKKPARKTVEEETVYEKNEGEVITDKRMDKIVNEVNNTNKPLPLEKDVNSERMPDGQERQRYRTEEELEELKKQEMKYKIKDRGL